ncbi:MAG TPA: hypothetical protein VFP44_21910, partial [Usitatibacter sp.]|nr:hypothetical protein [Usitatibacter sp.]
ETARLVHDRIFPDPDDVTVYRFTRLVRGSCEVCPMHMWGTAEAIASLGCTPLLSTARPVNRNLLEAGFYYEQAPGAFRKLEEHDADR